MAGQFGRVCLKLRSSTKLLIGSIAVAAGAYFGYQALAAYQVDRIVFDGVKPGHITLIGIHTGNGFRIIVSNQRAQLVQVGEKAEDFGVDVSDIENATEDTGDKPRVPLKEMMLSLQGDEKALGKLVTAMNANLRKAELPPVEVVWLAEDIQKALDGDSELKTKLEQDLNVHLDGTPLEEIRPSALQNGIVIESKVPVEVMVAGKTTTLHGPIRTPYVPSFVKKVNDRFEEVFNPTNQAILGYYMEEVQKLKDRPGDREDIGATLRSRISPENLTRNYAPNPTRVLKNAAVVLNESHLTAARAREVKQAGQHYADVILNLTEEGRKRLWQYSRRNPGIQLLLIRDGVAVAAPKIRGEVAQSEVTIRGVTNVTLAQETVDDVNRYAAKP